MNRALTGFLAITLFITCVFGDTENGHVALGLFQKVHLASNTTNGNPIVLLGGTSILHDGEQDDGMSERPENPHRIVGGQQISINQAPFQAAIIQDGQFVCGGSVISTIWVLTAGHCIYGFGNSTFLVRAGSDNFRTGGQARRVGFMAVHGQFASNQYTNDIAMMRVTRRFTFGSTVQPVRIATPNSPIPSTLAVTGWGSTSENNNNPSRRLRGTILNVVDRNTCRRRYAGSIYTIRRTMLCTSAPGRDSCQGDSGGPLVSQGVQYGIVSFGIGCARARYPGVNTNVGVMNTWILTVARTFSRRSFPDETGEHDIKRVVVQEESFPEDDDSVRYLLL